jgi:ATP-binding cassette, subfamily B, bacterial
VTSTRLSALFTPVIDLIEMGGVLVVLGVGTWDLAQGRPRMAAHSTASAAA